MNYTDYKSNYFPKKISLFFVFWAWVSASQVYAQTTTDSKILGKFMLEDRQTGEPITGQVTMNPACPSVSPKTFIADNTGLVTFEFSNFNACSGNGVYKFVISVSKGTAIKEFTFVNGKLVTLDVVLIDSPRNAYILLHSENPYRNINNALIKYKEELFYSDQGQIVIPYINGASDLRVTSPLTISHPEYTDYGEHHSMAELSTGFKIKLTRKSDDNDIFRDAHQIFQNTMNQLTASNIQHEEMIKHLTVLVDMQTIIVRLEKLSSENEKLRDEKYLGGLLSKEFQENRDVLQKLLPILKQLDEKASQQNKLVQSWEESVKSINSDGQLDIQKMDFLMETGIKILNIKVAMWQLKPDYMDIKEKILRHYDILVDTAKKFDSITNPAHKDELVQKALEKYPHISEHEIREAINEKYPTTRNYLANLQQDFNTIITKIKN